MTNDKWDEVIALYKKEFSADMPLHRMSEKMDTMNQHPDIQALRKLLCNDLVFALTELQYLLKKRISGRAAVFGRR